MMKVRQLRILNEVTLDAIFLKTGINQGKLSRIERGIIQPTKEEKKKISVALGFAEKEVFPEEK